MGTYEPYNVYFEIASVCFLILMLVLTKIKRQLNIFQNRLFFWGLFLAMILNIVDATSSILINYEIANPGRNVSPWCNWGITMLSYVLQQVLIQLFLVYFALFLKKDSKSNLVVKAMSVVSVVYGLLVLTTPFTRFIFYFTEDGEYRYGKFHFVLFLVLCMFGLFGFYIVFSNRRYLSRAIKFGI